MFNSLRCLGLLATIGGVVSLTGCAASMQAQNNNTFRAFEPMSVPQAGGPQRMAAARQSAPPAVARQHAAATAQQPAAQPVVQASAMVPIEQLEAPAAVAKAPLTVAPRRSIHDPQDIAPVPPPALASAAPPATRRPAAQPRQVAKKTSPTKQAKPKARQPVVEEDEAEEVVLAVSKPRRATQPKRAAAKVMVASTQADEAEVAAEDIAETELMPAAKLPKKTIASKGPQWRAAGSSFVAEKPTQVAAADAEPEQESRVQAVRWEKPARPAPAASIEEAVFEEEAGEEAADAGDAEAVEEDTAEVQPASRVRIVSLSNG
jgi:hypothetical protein